MRKAAAHSGAGASAPEGTSSEGVPLRQDNGTVALPVIEEQIAVAKKAIEVGRVRVSLETDVDHIHVHEALHGRRVEVERLTVGRVLADGEPPPRTREEGDMLIIPIVEEQAVVVKRLVLREELRLRFVSTETLFDEDVSVRRQRATVERVPAAPDRQADPNPSVPTTPKTIPKQ